MGCPVAERLIPDAATEIPSPMEIRAFKSQLRIALLSLTLTA